MKKKIIKSLKISSLLGFVSNNIKADYNLRLTFDIFQNNSAIFQLKGDNIAILNDPTKCTNDFLNVVKHNKSHHNVNNFKDIKSNYVPVYYYLKGQKDPKICSFSIEPFGESKLDFNGNEENVEEVVWVKKSDKKNIVTFCSNDDFKKIIKGKEFLVDKDYIYNIILSNNGFSKSIDDVKKMCDININLDKDNNQNIEIIYNYIFKIPGTEEFKISEKDIKDNDFITPLNKLENLYINTNNIGNVFDDDGTIKKEAIKYIFAYNSEKYYIISDKEHKQNELFGFLKTKNDLKDKDLIFDPNGEIKIEEGTGNLVPGEYKIIEKKPKEKPEKPEKPQTLFKYMFTGVTSLSKWIGENFEASEKVEVQSLFDNQDTSKYVFVAIKEGTNERFINNQIIEPGTYELKREEKPNEDNKNKKKEKGDDQGDPEKSRKICSCC